MTPNGLTLTSFGCLASHLRQPHLSVAILSTPVKVLLVSNHGLAPTQTPLL